MFASYNQLQMYLFFSDKGNLLDSSPGTLLHLQCEWLNSGVTISHKRFVPEPTIAFHLTFAFVNNYQLGLG